MNYFAHDNPVVKIQLSFKVKKRKRLEHHDFYDTIDGLRLYLWFPVSDVHGYVVVSVQFSGRADDVPQPQLIDVPGRGH